MSREQAVIEKIVEEYVSLLKQSEFFGEIVSVMILGSFGRYDANNASDMDVWLICKDDSIVNLSRLSNIASAERALRTRLGIKYNYPNLDRHLASFFSQEEASLYQNIFYTRVLNPKKLGEIVQIDFVDSFFDTRVIQYELSDTQKAADLAQSLNEFVENWNKAKERSLSMNISKKWLRRIFQEIEFCRNGTRIKSSRTLDIGIREKYENDSKAVFDDVQLLMKNLSQKTDETEISRSRLLHSLLWTLEKVRWEIIFSQNSKLYFNQWRLGKVRGYGFSPREIGNLVSEAVIDYSAYSTFTNELAEHLIYLTRISENIERLEHLNVVLSKWVIDTAMILIGKRNSTGLEKVIIPTFIDGINTISKIYPIKDSRLAYAEFSAWNIINSKHIIGIDQSKYSILIIQEDIFSNKLDVDNIEKYLLQYADVVKQIHQKPIEYFGRLNWKYPHDCYSDYLLSRLKGLKISDERINKIAHLIKDYKSILDSEDPYLCHMDPGPRNLIISDKDRLFLIDFEHASGCSPIWDIERILFQIPMKYHDRFLRLYGKEINQMVSAITRLVMVTCFACRLSNDQGVQEICFDYVDNVLKSDKMTEYPRMVLMDKNK